jgi:hypothetical protein
MSYCPVIKGISALGFHCPPIDLSGCVKINNNGITLLAEGCRELLSIDLDCTLITDIGLSQLPQYCSKLQSISLTTCVGITYRGIAALDRGCLQLQDDSIEIEGCKDIENILHRISARDTELKVNCIGFYGEYMMYHLPIQYRSKVSNTVSTLVTTMSYGITIVYMKLVICCSHVVESWFSSYSELQFGSLHCSLRVIHDK